MNSKSPESLRLLQSLDDLTSVVWSVECQQDTSIQQPDLVIALSGGLDSVVLLAVAAEWQKQCGNVRALYIDHGLQSQSREWGHHCATLCESLNVPFKVESVHVDLESGLSPEGAARDARYQAFEKQLAVGEMLCTAHHADDQAETLLLQLFRGAGPHGLGAMPPYRRFAQGYLLRPLLQFTREELKRYANDHSLRWCEDPSNTDTRYDRNFVRHNLMPDMAARWPGLVNNLSRSASHCRDAVTLMRELAEVDLAAANGLTAELPISCLQPLSIERCNNALRYWISANGYQAPSQIQLQQIVSDLVNAHRDSHGRISFGTAQVARYRDNLFIGERQAFDPAADFEYQWPDIRLPLKIPEANWELVSDSRPKLQSRSAKCDQPLTVRNRRGGERLWRAGRHVEVKSLLQQKHVPPWQRSRLALVFCGDELIDICGPEFYL